MEKKSKQTKKQKKTQNICTYFLTVNINFAFAIPLPNVKAQMFYISNSFIR